MASFCTTGSNGAPGKVISVSLAGDPGGGAIPERNSGRAQQRMLEEATSNGSRPSWQWCLQARSLAWSQVPCAIQWLQPEPKAGLIPIRRVLCLRDLAVAWSGKDKTHGKTETAKSVKKHREKCPERKAQEKKGDVPGGPARPGTERRRYRYRVP